MVAHASLLIRRLGRWASGARLRSSFLCEVRLRSKRFAAVFSCRSHSHRGFRDRVKTKRKLVALEPSEQRVNR